MKILLLSDLNIQSTNGVVISTMNLCRALQARGHEVRVLMLSPQHASYTDGDIFFVKSWPFPVYPGVRVSLASHDREVQALLSWHPDIVHSQCEFSTFRFAKRIAQACQAPLVHTYHTMYEYYVRYLFKTNRVWPLAKKLIRHLLRACDVIIAPTGKVAASLRDMRVDGDIRVIPTGIDLKKYDTRLTEEERRAILQELQLPEGVHIIGSVGRLAKEKDFDAVLRAFALARPSLPPTALVLTGDGVWRAHLEELARSLGIADSVRFTGMKAPTEISRYYRILEIFLSASVSETQGLTYIEALANGIPVVARKDTVLEGVVTEGKNGMLFEQTEACAAILRALLNDPVRLQALQRGAWASREAFGMERFGEHMEAVYTELLSE